MANIITYLSDFERVLQDRLDENTTWKEMCDVKYPDGQVWRSSYISTEMTSAAVTRGTATNATDVTITSETLTVSTDREVKVFLDYADEAQQPWFQRAEIFDRIGSILNYYIEGQVLAQHTSWTNIGDVGGGAIGLGATPISVSASNIDDIIRGVKTQIRVANGSFLANQYGIGFVWRPADFELLEAFTQANGTQTADRFLIDGTVDGLHYLGADHYWSNGFTANHVLAGVKKVQTLGILGKLYGRAFIIENPAGSSGGNLSGTSFMSRVGVGHLTKTAHAGIVFDVNVS